MKIFHLRTAELYERRVSSRVFAASRGVSQEYGEKDGLNHHIVSELVIVRNKRASQLWAR
jgi:hypothetical protein